MIFTYSKLLMQMLYLLPLNVLEIDECISNPCHTNAVCQDGINAHDCTCQEGFTGDGTTCAGNLITDNL